VAGRCSSRRNRRRRSPPYISAILSDVDPFIGTAATCLPPPSGLAASWWWPKPQVGNTHPGATSPLGMVSACAYSGAYPTGYGRYGKNTEGVPEEMFAHLQASGFTHFQQSGTGAIRKYYNYARVTPMIAPLDELGESWPLHDETAAAGYYAATLDTGVRCEITVGEKAAVHRYTFPESDVAALTAALDRAVLEMPEHERRDLERRGRDHALAFDRERVFDDLFPPDIPITTVPPPLLHEEQVVPSV
jgi:Glycosyl hydrolase family 92 N-terminal domain